MPEEAIVVTLHAEGAQIYECKAGSDRKLAYAYLVTPSGLREKLRLTRSFLVRKEAEFDQLQTVIADLRAELEGNA